MSLVSVSVGSVVCSGLDASEGTIEALPEVSVEVMDARLGDFLLRFELPRVGILLAVLLPAKVVGCLIFDATLFGDSLIEFLGDMLGRSEAIVVGEARFGIPEGAEAEVMDCERCGKAGIGGWGLGRDREAVIG